MPVSASLSSRERVQRMFAREDLAKFAAAKPTKGYIYHSDHSIPPQVCWGTYQEIIRMVERHGRY